MAGFVPFRNICAIFNCIAFKLILCFNYATSYTRKPLATILKLIDAYVIWIYIKFFPDMNTKHIPVR